MRLLADNTTINLGAPAGYNNLTGITAGGVVAFGIQMVLIIAAIVFFFMLVWGGIEWIMAGGDKAGAENARKRITNALIGLAVVFAAWAIVNLVNMVFGVNILSMNIPSIVNLSK